LKIMYNKTVRKAAFGILFCSLIGIAVPTVPEAGAKNEKEQTRTVEGKEVDAMRESQGARDAIVADYPLDENDSILAHDRNGYGGYGKIYYAEVVTNASGVFGLEFTRPWSWVEITNSTPLNFESDFTIEAWIRPTDLRGTQYLVSNGVLWFPEGYLLYLQDTELVFLLNTGKGRFVVKAVCPSIQPLKWTHLVAVYDSSAKHIKLFVDGKAVGQTYAEGIPKRYASYGGKLCIGAIACGSATSRHEGNGQFNGFIRDLKFYRTALSSKQAQENCLSSNEQMAGLSFPTQKERFVRGCSAVLTGCVLDENARLASARIYVKASDGKYYGPERLFYDQTGEMTSPARFYAINGHFSVSLPPGKAEIVCLHGPEYWPFEQEVNLAANSKREITINLRRLVNMPAKGWFSGDHHFHCGTHGNFVRELFPAWPEVCEIGRAEGLAFISVKEKDWWEGKSNQVKTPDFLAKIDGGESRSHGNFGGHVPYVTGNTPRKEMPRGDKFAFLEAQRLNAIACSHGHEGKAISNAPAWCSRDIIAAIPFGQGRYLWDFNLGDEKLWNQAYPAFLNCGFKMPVSVSSDADLNVFLGCVGKTRPPAGNYRVYLKLSGLDWDEIVSAYMKGSMLASGGPIVMLQIGGKDPGDVVFLESKTNVDARIEAYASQGVGRIELIQNGKIVQALEAGDAAQFQKIVPISVSNTCWILARCLAKDSKYFGSRAWTSPIYIQVADKPMMPQEEDLAVLQEWIDDYRAALPQARKIYPLLDFDEIQDWLNKVENEFQQLKSRPRNWKQQ